MAVDGMIANGVTEILKQLSFVVANEITLVWDLNDELENLQSTLNMIMAVMDDAEKKQASNLAVRLWMEKLKSIAYDAEDILDDYSYEIICKQTKEVRKPSLFFRWRMAHKIKKINERFNKIAKHKNDLGLQIIDVGSSSSSSPHVMMMMMNRETYSLVAADWKIVGRENDKSNIINMLLVKDSCLVLAIVGLGGMGKTTVAQLVYNDEVVHTHFQVKIWICVSDPFDVKKLFKNIVNSMGIAKQYDDVATMDDLAHRLQDAFIGKKFLLVLDDVWNENPEDWYKFKTPFMVGAEGSKILITTRSMDVASIMIDKFLPYELGILNEDDCWFLFKEIAFGSVAAGATESPKLVEIGKMMVKRCGGLPLAVIFLGSLMRSKKKEEEWENIQNTKIWHESHDGKKSTHRILPSLRLSYDYLPSHLKLCFSYCCLFPKDSIIHRKTLIQLWMAEGFLIESPEENAMSMEEIGNEYFHNLLCNFFFQDVEKDQDGDIAACKMHDLVHDLARSVVGKNECLIVESADDIGLISEATRRLNLLVNLKEMLPKVLKALKKAKKLKTVFVSQQTIDFDIGKAFKENKRLRVLDLNGSVVRNTSINCFGVVVNNASGLTSSSIGELKHLRYLYLPGRFTIPKGIGRLRFLQTLSEFNLGRYSYWPNNAGGIKELEGLSLLRGDLLIKNLQNVTSGTDACRANLKERKNLRSLNLSWTTLHQRYDHHSEAVLEGLLPHGPHPNLRTLGIRGFQGSKFPRWIEDSSCLPNLVKLTLHGGIYVQGAGFGALPSLRSLILRSMDNLECIGNEFYYSAAAGGSLSSAGGKGGESSSSSTGEASTTTKAFPSLKIIYLENMDSLKEWVVPPPLSTTRRSTNSYCFPLLEKIIINSCPLLSTITPTTTIFPSLKVLHLEGIDGRTAVETLVTNNLNSLTSLTLRNIPNLITLPRQGLMENNNTLLSLCIDRCYQFQGFFPPTKDEEGEEDQDVGKEEQVSSTSSSSSLQSLTLCGSPALRLYPNILRSLTSLRELEIQEYKESKSLQDELMTCLSSSSSSSLEHLEYVKILKNNETPFEWRKSKFF